MTEFSIYLDNSASAVSGVAPTAPEQTAQINWAIRRLAKFCRLYDPRITFNIYPTALVNTNGAQYNIRDAPGTVSKKVAKPLVVYISGEPLLDWKGDPGLYSVTQLQNWRKTYLTEASNTSTIAAYAGGGRLILSPPPTSAGSNNFIAGLYLPADLRNGTDDDAYPDMGIVEELHECIAYMAALQAAIPTATESEQWQRIAAYRAEWMEAALEVRSDNENAIEGNWEDAGHDFRRFMRV